MAAYPYQDQSLPVSKRVDDLLGRMSLEEKVGQVNQRLYGWECYRPCGDGGWELTDAFKEHVAWGGGIGALYGAFRADPWSKVDYSCGVRAHDAWKVTNLIQSYVVEHSRWGIPALMVEECPHGHQALDGVSYPTNIGRGCMFDAELTRRAAHLMARELACKGVDIALVSTLDLMRDPRWGRSEECFGEDPMLAARYTEAIVDGFQNGLVRDGLRLGAQTVSGSAAADTRSVGVVLKHCIAQGDAQGGHNSGTVVIGQREFSDVYRPLLCAARNAAGIMAAYNDIDGVPCHANAELLEYELRTRAGFQGIVMADGTALDRLVDVYGLHAAAAAAALRAGVDMSLWDETYLHVGEAVERGFASMGDLDRAVRRVLTLKFALGLFDHPFVEDPGEELDRVIDEAREVNLACAEESLVLVKNDGILPLSVGTFAAAGIGNDVADDAVADGVSAACAQTDDALCSPRRIAVIGPNAHTLYSMLGDYSAPQMDDALGATIFREVQRMFPDASVCYAKGCAVREQEGQDALIAEAVEVARGSDIALLCLGGSSARNFDMEFLRNGAVSSRGANMDAGENVDVSSLALGGCQMELARAVAATGTPVVSVLVQGRPYEIEELESLSAAVLLVWYPGRRGGEAVARALAGACEPSGRLSVSYPRSSGQLPVYYYQRCAAKNEHYFDGSGAPLHPFGFGLGYGQVVYDGLSVGTEDGGVRASVTVRNLGRRETTEPVLLFVQLRGSGVLQRPAMLKAFERVRLAPGEERSVAFDVGIDALVFSGALSEDECASRITVRVANLAQDIELG